MYDTKLLMFLCPWINNTIREKLPNGTLPVFPFHQLVSRIKYKSDPFDCKLACEPLSDIIALPNHNNTFADVADARALELKKLNGTVFLLWSGGIDSTVVLTSILKNWDQEDLSRLVVLCDANSIDENTTLFRLIVKLGITIRISTGDVERFLHRGYVVTGELGDQLFGHDMVGDCTKYFGESAINTSWRVTVPAIFKIVAPTHWQSSFENYSQIVDEAPFTLESTHDFFWWLNISQKWQNVKYRILMAPSWKNPELTFPNLIHFYDTVPFQVWSIHNHDKKIKSTLQSYKFTAKEYIIEYTRDTNYLKKLKLSSLQNLYSMQPLNWAIDENWNFLNKEESLRRALQ